jgi:AcrR family transcriptional regulator
MRLMTKKPAYHHGDLRHALIEAALQILETHGRQGLTLRGVAARAGVSHAAPAHHFPNIKSLITELCTIGFLRFHQTIAQECAAAARDAPSQLRAANSGYMAFATGQPEFFQLMFSTPASDWTDPELYAASMFARRQLADVCGPASDALGLNSAEDRGRLERLVWSCVHGHAHLLIEGRLSGQGPESSSDILDITSLIFSHQQQAKP